MTTESHEHEYPVNPPRHSWAEPGPCIHCGKAYAHPTMLLAEAGR